ncbi:MAG TPA: hypothetical protein VFQ68_17955, partial [Streptosporangiaceae bacterium]|nr:hypothetical protein [Streptosporangiaceae bacterium]
ASGPERTGGGTGPAPAAPADLVFRRDGEVWTLRYGGREVRLRDSKGLSAGTELVEFSPTGALSETMAVVGKNLDAARS